jgi:phosphatidylglycerophosphate synthase
MLANTITLCRLLLTFAVIVLFGMHRALDLGLITIIVFIFALDGIDRYIACRRNETVLPSEI